MTERDHVLGARLRALEVPPHRPGFFTDLAQRLRLEPPAAPAGRRLRRKPGWERSRNLVAVAAAVALTLLTVGVLRGGGGPGGGGGGDGPAPGGPSPGEPQLISATQVRVRVASALAGLRSLEGQVTVECAVARGDCSPPEGGGRGMRRWSFVTTAAGDERTTGLDHQEDVAYRAAAREQRAVVASEAGLLAEVLTGLPPGPPDFGGRPSVLRRDYGSVVRAFLATTAEVPVETVTHEGREAWRLVTPVEPNPLAGPGRSGDRLEVVVDRASGFPLRVTETLGERFLHEVRVTALEVDRAVDPGVFTLDLPAGVEAYRRDAGFRTVGVGGLAAEVSYPPVLPAPSSLPPGYRLAEVTVADEGRPTGTEGLNPRGEDVVSIAYRRGFDRIVVTTRRVGGVPSCERLVPGSGSTRCWDDPLASGEGIRDQPEPFTVPSGALAGARAELVISPRGIPHVWTIDDRLVVTVAGDATGDELRRMAASFAPPG